MTCRGYRFKDYRFRTEDGEASLRDLFGGRSQMLVYHFMFDPDWDEGCPSCSAVTDGFAGSIPHFEHHDVAFVVVSRAPLDKLIAYKRRMAWDLRWVSSLGSSFNYDFHVTIDPAVAPVEYNYKDQAQLEAENVAWRDWSGEQPGMSAFARDGDEVFHTILRVCPRLRRAVDDVAVAGPCAAGPQRRRQGHGFIGTTSTPQSPQFPGPATGTPARPGNGPERSAQQETAMSAQSPDPSITAGTVPGRRDALTASPPPGRRPRPIVPPAGSCRCRRPSGPGIGRYRHLGRADRESLYAVLEAGLVAHLGVITGGWPMVVPTMYVPARHVHRPAAVPDNPEDDHA